MNNYFFFKSFLRVLILLPFCLSWTPILAIGTNDVSIKNYHFQADTVWGKLSILVQDQHGRFRVEGQCDSPVSGWFLKNEKGQTLARGNQEGSNSFKTDVSLPFQNVYRLTVLVKGDQGGVPVVVLLSPTGDQVWLTPTPPPFDAFVEDVDRPYDTIVKNLYNQAAEAYVNGNKEKAMDFLRKAEKLDPQQPQVLSLGKKLKGSLEESESREIIRQAELDWKASETEKALSGLDSFLDQYPADGPALELKKRITQTQSQATEPVAKKRKPKLKVVITPTPTDKKPAFSDQDRQSQADQAYNLGLESYRKEDYASAKKFWEQTLQLQPNHPQARRNLERLTEEHPELK